MSQVISNKKDIQYSPSERLRMNFHDEFMKRINELGVKYIEEKPESYVFNHQGFRCEIIFKSK